MPKNQIWIEVEFLPDGIYFNDWTPMVGSDGFRYWRKEFIKIEGKTTDFYVKGFDEYDLAKSFAIWWFTEKQNCNISRYRLD